MVKRGTLGWGIISTNNTSRGQNGIPMDGMSCL